MIWNMYPYTDFHNMNQDWIIRILKEMEKKLEDFVSTNSIKYANPFQWSIVNQYEKNTLVIEPNTGTAYLSVQAVPVGVSISNSSYWTPVFDLSAILTGLNENLTEHNEQLNITSSTNYAVGDWIIWKNYLYRATASITAGDLLNIGVNIEKITLEMIADELSNNINNVLSLLNDHINNVPYVNIFDYDITPGADNTEELTQAISDAVSKGLPLVINGVTIKSDTIALPGKLEIFGNGTIKPLKTEDSGKHKNKTLFTSSYDLTIKGITIEGYLDVNDLDDWTGSTEVANTLIVTTGANLFIDGCTFKNIDQKYSNSPYGPALINCYNPNNVKIVNCVFDEANGEEYIMVKGDTPADIKNVYISDNTFKNIRTTCFDIYAEDLIMERNKYNMSYAGSLVNCFSNNVLIDGDIITGGTIANAYDNTEEGLANKGTNFIVKNVTVSGANITKFVATMCENTVISGFKSDTLIVELVKFYLNGNVGTISAGSINVINSNLDNVYLVFSTAETGNEAVVLNMIGCVRNQTSNFDILLDGANTTPFAGILNIINNTIQMTGGYATTSGYLVYITAVKILSIIGNTLLHSASQSNAVIGTFKGVFDCNVTPSPSAVAIASDLTNVKRVGNYGFTE